MPISPVRCATPYDGWEAGIRSQSFGVRDVQPLSGPHRAKRCMLIFLPISIVSMSSGP